QVILAPGRFETPPDVSLSSYAAGQSTTANLSFAISNPIPQNGHIIVTFPSNFTSISTSEVVSWGMDGGFIVDVEAYTVTIHRDGSGGEVQAGSLVTVQLQNGIKTQGFEGATTVFPLVKTTLEDTTISIDEAS
ncbi:unnamed protein product, partial [Hapterophycus canaliculatus]